MDFQGDLDAIPAGEQYRWTFTTYNGATHMSGKKYRRKADAIKAGSVWVKERRKELGVGLSPYELSRMPGRSVGQ